MLDPDPRRVARGRAEHPDLRFVEAEAESLPFGPERFQRLVSLYSFHHFRDPMRVFAEAHRVLVPGGTFTICDVIGRSWHARIFQLLHRISGHAAFPFRDPEELARGLRDAGFARVDRGTIGAHYRVTAIR